MKAHAPTPLNPLASRLPRWLRPFNALVGASLLWLTCSSFGQTQSPSQTTLQIAAQQTRPPALSPSTNNSAPTATERTSSDIDAQQQDMQARLIATQADLAKVQHALNAMNAPASEAYVSTKERLNDLVHLVDTYTHVIDNIKNLRRLSDKLANARKDKLAWQPPSGSAPWPIALADDLQFEIIRINAQLQHLSQRHTLIDAQLTELKKSRSATEADLRQITQKTETTSSTEPLPNKAVIDNERRLSRINLELVNLSIDKDANAFEQTTAAVTLSLFQKNWDFYAHRFVFSNEDFNKIRGDIQRANEQTRAQEQQASSRINRTLDQAASAKTRLDQLESTPNAVADAVITAKRAWNTADALAETARIEREKYRSQIELNLASLQIWEIRQKIYSNTDVARELSDMMLRQQTLAKQLAQGLSHLTEIIADKSQAAVNISTQVQQATDLAEKSFLQGLLAQISAQIDSTRSLYSVIGRLNQYLQIVGAELEYANTHKTLLQRLETARALVTEVSKEVWHYELFAVDDSIIVDGREIKTKRGITIGKTAGAIIILIVGFVLISRLIRRTLALAVNKANLGISKSVVLGRWLTLVAGFTLILTALNLVDIPLSAFAFLGGALAIGVGFGTQNILKNLISGVMLLIEKPIRIGDLVEIDGVIGTVTSIGIRFSTVHGPQGNDTLIPNSTLVEQRLINWTYTSTNARRDIRVTVGYGSDAQSVREILLSVGKENPHVLGTPGPLVTLDDFGDNGLVFNLQFWVKLQTGVLVNEIQSDLRMQILGRFAAAGIDLPFPQRTVLFNQDAPLAVHVQPRTKSNRHAPE